MQLNLHQLSEGANPVSFTLGAERLRAIVGLVDDLYDVPQAEVEVALSLWKSHRTVTMRGALELDLSFQCAGCLEPATQTVRIPLDWTLLPRKALSGRGATGPDGVELQPDDLNVSFVDEERVELEELVREALLLEVEPCPRCPVDTCGASAYMAPPSPEVEAEEGPASRPLDPRWAALAELRERLRDNQD